MIGHLLGASGAVELVFSAMATHNSQLPPTIEAAALGSLGLAGFVFLPWTTFVYAAAYDPFRGVTGLGIALVVFAFLVDVASWFGGNEANRNRRQPDYA